MHHNVCILVLHEYVSKRDIILCEINYLPSGRFVSTSRHCWDDPIDILYLSALIVKNCVD